MENLFERPKVMNLPKWSDGRAVLNDFARLNDLIQEDVYTEAVKTELLTLMGRNGALLTKGESAFIRLRENKGKLIKRPKNAPAEVRVNGRSEWLGWFELISAPVDEGATLNTARIIKLLDADVLCLVEIENRPGLVRFQKEMFPRVGAQSYDHIMVIEGNDDRGIDVAILTRKGFEITHMRSHVDDRDAKGVIFSRDCPEFEIITPEGDRILLLLNHFKSKGYGDAAASKAKRLRQSTRVRQIYDERRAAGYDSIAVLGDLNSNPSDSELAPLLSNGTDLKDIANHASFADGGYPGTYGPCNTKDKIDFMLLSPELFARVQAGNYERRGMLVGDNGTRFEHLSSVMEVIDAASDHAVLVALI